MSRPRRFSSITWGALAALAALWLLAFWPVARAGYPAIGDGLNHFYRLVEFEHLLRQGIWFPRWAADLGYGYGYPLFNFYPSLTYYLGALFHSLGLSEGNSLLAVYGLGWALGLGGAYRLAREQCSQTAALAAAAAFGFAPYLYFNALARGAGPETLARGLLPWGLWAYQRLAIRPGRGALTFAGLLTAGLILTHLLTALLAMPLMALFWLLAERPRRPRRLAPAIAAGLVGFGLAAYFLLPALLETGAVQLGQLTQPGDLDFHNNFISPNTLLAWPETFDPRLVFHVVPPSLSLAALALAVLGLALGLWRRRGTGRLNIGDAGLWLGLLALAGLALAPSRWVWELVPGMGLIQFPWRLVGPASLLLALLAGRGVEALETEIAPQARGWLAPAAVAALGLYALTWTFSAGTPAPATGS
ncbi:MAG: 6-pyruvoyl-tetrahydropterin synthase-related protein, partial [Anaerolineales bacterium]